MKLDELRRLTRIMGKPGSPADQEKLQEQLWAMGVDPGNLYQELEMTSRYVDTHQDISYPGAVMHLHSHIFYEILCCRSTSGVEYLVGAQRYRLQRGDIVLVPPGVSHRPLLPENMAEPYRRDVLWLSLEFAEGLQSMFPEVIQTEDKQVYLLRTANTRWEQLVDLFHRGVVESEQREQGWEAALIGNTVLVLTLLRRALQDKHAMGPDAETPELLDRVLAYVEKHLGEKLSLTEVAKHFFVSEATITQTFRRKMGTSFYRCVTQRRLIAAKLLIEQGGLLEHVGQQVGFSDYSTFYRAFRQEFGISPRQYRKRQENGSAD